MHAGRTVVIDLEATCWDHDEPALAADQRNQCEIIEVGAVVLGDQETRFRGVVRPRRHPALSAFCTELTGLTQAEVDAGEPFPDVWSQFCDWAGPADRVVIASWGGFDPAQISRDLRRHGLADLGYPTINIKREFSRVARQRGAPARGWMALGRALHWVGYAFEGRQHSAVDDAVNAARLLSWARATG